MRSDPLTDLALRLQPLLQRRAEVLNRPLELAQLTIQLRKAGLPELQQKLAGSCRSYFAQHGAVRGMAVEDFILEVQLLTFAKLVNFDPAQANFFTWFSRHILPRVYSDLQRQQNPGWGRPLATTAEGQRVRQTVLNLVQALPLEPKHHPSYLASTEQALLEAQCREYFRQCLAQLSSADQILVQRFYVQGEPQKEIAQSLNVSPATICVRLKKICQQLATLLGEPFVTDCSDTEFCQVFRHD